MDKRVNPNQRKRKRDSRASADHTFRVFSKRHGGKSDRRGEPDGRGNKTGHESKRRMINGRKKMVFAARSWQSGTEFAVTERAAKRHHSAHDPEQNQREARLDVGDLKPKAGEDTRPDNVSNNDRSGCPKSHSTGRWRAGPIFRRDMRDGMRHARSDDSGSIGFTRFKSFELRLFQEAAF